MDVAERALGQGIRGLASGVWILALSACGMSEPTFVEQYTDAYCNYAVACSGEATMVFDGYDRDTCASVIGPRTEGRMDSCRRYSRKFAKDCVQALLDAQCPEDGDVDAGQPVACQNVHTECVVVLNEEPVDASEGSEDVK